MGLLNSAELLLQTKNYSGSGNWLDEANSHDATNNGALFLPYIGQKYLYLPGINNNNAEVPTDVSLDLTEDVEIRLDLQLDDYSPASSNETFTRYVSTGNHRQFRLVVTTAGNLQFGIGDGSGAFRADFAVASGLTDGQRYQLRIVLDGDDGAGNTDVSFYQRPADEALDADTVAWAQIGTTQTDVGLQTWKAVTAPIEVGSRLSQFVSIGRIYRALYWKDLTKTDLAVDIHFDDPGVVEPYSTFTELSPNGATVTINRTATGVKATLVDRPLWLLGGNDHLEVADDAGLDVTASDAATLMVWGRIYDTSPDEDQVLVGKKDNLTTSAGYTLYVESADATAKFLIGDGSLDDEDPTPNLTVGQGFVITGVKNETDDDIESFLDGTGGSAVTDSTTATLANALAFNIGASSNATPASYLDGEVFAVVFWNVALSDADVAKAGRELTTLLPNAIMLMGVG